MNKAKKYLLEILLILTVIVAGIVMLSCGSGEAQPPEESKFVVATPEPEPTATPEPEPTVEPSPEKTPEPTPAPLEFTTGDMDYFKDALFIGDSRTVGLKEYSDLGDYATFFCSVGMNSFKIFDESCDVNGVGTVSLKQLLTSKQFGKVYILLGINELGSSTDAIAEKIGNVLDYVKETQPNAIIFMEANMHVTANKNASDKTFNNEKINALNEAIAAFADDETVFYIDVNELFDDANGCLDSELSGDGIHVNGKGYMDWGNWFATKEIIIPEN